MQSFFDQAMHVSKMCTDILIINPLLKRAIRQKVTSSRYYFHGHASSEELFCFGNSFFGSRSPRIDNENDDSTPKSKANNINETSSQQDSFPAVYSSKSDR